MRRKFAPLAVLFGLIGALLLAGASTASAGATFDCDNVDSISVVKVKCVSVGVSDVLKDITIEVTDVRVLTDNEISILENNLNNAKVDINVLENVTINTLNNFGGIHISDVNVKVCAVVVGAFLKQCT